MIGYNSNNWYKCVGMELKIDSTFYKGYNDYLKNYGIATHTLPQLRKIFKKFEDKKLIFSYKTMSQLLRITYGNDYIFYSDNEHNKIIIDTIYNLLEIKALLIDYYDTFNNIIDDESDQCKYYFDETNNLVKNFVLGCLYLWGYLHSNGYYSHDEQTNKIYFLVNTYIKCIAKVENILIHNDRGIQLLSSECFELTHNNPYYKFLDILDNNGKYTRIEKHLLLTYFYEYNERNMLSRVEQQGIATLLFLKFLNGYTFEEFEKILKKKHKFNLDNYPIDKIENNQITIDSWDYYHVFGINMNQYHNHLIDSFEYCVKIIGIDSKEYSLVNKEYEIFLEVKKGADKY